MKKRRIQVKTHRRRNAKGPATIVRQHTRNIKVRGNQKQLLKRTKTFISEDEKSILKAMRKWARSKRALSPYLGMSTESINMLSGIYWYATTESLLYELQEKGLVDEAPRGWALTKGKIWKGNL